LTIANGNRRIAPSLFNRLGDNVDLENEKVRKLSFWNDAELFRCREGNGALALKFREGIEKLGGKIYNETEVVTVHVGDKNVEISIRKGNNPAVPFEVPGVKFDRIVCSVAPSSWSRISFHPSVLPDVHPQMGYVVKYLFHVHQETVDLFRQCEDAAHTSWAMVWEAENNKQVVSKTKTLAIFAGGKHAKQFTNPPNPRNLPVEQARREYIIDNLNRMLPTGHPRNFHVEDIIESVFMDWPQDPEVEGGYSCPAVGEVTALGPFIHSCVKEKLYFAGEFSCRYKWCGFMEGALISGAGVAKRMLKDYEDHINKTSSHKEE